MQLETNRMIELVQNGERSASMLYTCIHACIPCLLNLYAEYIMQNAGLDESQAGIKIAGRIINNFRYAEVHIFLL